MLTAWTPLLQGIARIIFGFLLLRHGMEQAFGYPEASDAAMNSYRGVLELLSLPGAVLIMLGLFTRPVCLVFAVLYLVMAVVGPLQVNWLTHRNGADPFLLNGFFFLYLATAGGGALSLDRLRNPTREASADNRWAPYSLGVLRIAAGYLFWLHGLEKWFGIGGGNASINVTTIRGFAGLIETVGGPLVMLGLFSRATVFILSGEMAVAYWTSWAPRGFWPSFAGPGMESSILFCFLFLFLWAAGPGRWSLDGVWAARRRATAERKATAEGGV
jgi:putative oxidoreductase